jgi:hypothetical protein
MEHIMPLKPDTMQRIKKETIAALRQATHSHLVDTGKLKKMLSEAEQRILMQVAPIQDAVDKQGSTIDFLRRLVGARVKKEKRQV